MNDAPIQKLIWVRIQQAQDSLQEAETLFQSELYRGVINRSYYAMFYAILALVILRQVATSKHSGAIAFFDREFVKTGIFPKALSKSLHFAYQKRQETDYGDVLSVNEDEASLALRDAQAFVARIVEYLRSPASEEG